MLPDVSMTRVTSTSRPVSLKGVIETPVTGLPFSVRVTDRAVADPSTDAVIETFGKLDTSTLRM
jgi:hypothetical protein